MQIQLRKKVSRQLIYYRAHPISILWKRSWMLDQGHIMITKTSIRKKELSL